MVSSPSLLLRALCPTGRKFAQEVPSFPLRLNSLGMIAPSGESPGGRKRWHFSRAHSGHWAALPQAVFSKERQRRASIDATTLNAACYDKKVLAPRRS
jgi:hypothetical protein